MQKSANCRLWQKLCYEISLNKEIWLCDFDKNGAKVVWEHVKDLTKFREVDMQILIVKNLHVCNPLW